MVIIHSADQHLDSRLTANLSKEKAKERKAEILITFNNMIKYAVSINATAILLAGDLFDTKTVSATERKAVTAAIVDHPDITFFYLKGNHDMNSFLSSLENIPDNLKLFDNHWTSYELSEDVIITGAELCESNQLSIFNELTLDSGKFNIVMLHGQENEYSAKDKTEVIPLSDLRNKSIDYLALGHVHEYKYKQLDARGMYCYPGCLEGRGFDETGLHGFVVLDIDEGSHTYTHEFKSISKRTLHEIEVDITAAEDIAEVEKKIIAVIEEMRGKVEVPLRDQDLVKLILTGAIDEECNIDTGYLTKCFEDEFYFVKIYDHTTRKIDFEKYRLDESLKGEFVRTVQADSSLSDEDKFNIITKGISLLTGR